MSISLGVAYYPEHTEPANWDGDLARIRASGMSFVCEMDISWTKVEPQTMRLHDCAGLDLLSGNACPGELKLAPYGAAVLSIAP